MSNTGLEINNKLMLQRSGGQSEMVTITDAGEYITVKYRDESSKSFIPIYETNTFIDINDGAEYFYMTIESIGENGEFGVNISFQQAISDPSLQDVTERMIWNMIGSEVPTCNCSRCLLRQIAILESALTNVPDIPECMLAAVFINEVMIPRISRLAAVNIFDIINEIVNDDDELLMRSMTEGGNVRHAASEETISKMTNFIKPYNRSVHGEDASCAFCLETFEDITKEQNGTPPMVVTCPGCKGKQTFCAGSKKSAEGCCKGFLGQMGVDHRCPCCRMSVRDWPNEEENQEPVKEDISEPSLNIPSNYKEGIYNESYDKMTPFYMADIDLIDYPKNKRKKMYNKFKEKIPYVRSQNRFFNRKLHNRQLYGRSNRR